MSINPAAMATFPLVIAVRRSPYGRSGASSWKNLLDPRVISEVAVSIRHCLLIGISRAIERNLGRNVDRTSFISISIMRSAASCQFVRFAKPLFVASG
jgi:hypothetical protein